MNSATDRDYRFWERMPTIDIDLANAIAALTVAVVSFLVLQGLLALARHKLCSAAEEQDVLRRDGTITDIMRNILASTSHLTLFVTALLIGLAVLDLPPPWNERVKHLWFIGLGAQLVLYLHKAVGVGARHYFARNARNPDAADSVAHSLVVWALQTAVWVVFALAVLANLGINITTFVASLGIGGIAIALAMQNILGDLFASLSIAMDKPFEVGDAISVAEFSGTVEHVGLKTTRVRSDSGEQIVISNTELLKSTVRNFKRMSRRRVQFNLRISPETPHRLVARLPQELGEIIKRQPKVKFDRAHLKHVEQNGFDFDIVYYVLDPGYVTYMDSQQTILIETLAALDRMGIDLSTAPRHVIVEQAGPAHERSAPALGLTRR